MNATDNERLGMKSRQEITRLRPAFIASRLFAAMLSSVVLAACASQTAQQGNRTAPVNTASPQQQTATPGQTAATGSGDVVVRPIMHASLQLEYGGKVIHVDPSGQGDYSKAKQADLILVTDIHGDHLDPEAISRIRKAGAPVVAPAAAAEKIENATVMANGESRTLIGINIETVPMYNLKRGPSEGQLFHPKGRGNGYILSLGNQRVYIAGDTECVPEMRALKNIDIAFIPMNLPYTMPPSEAAECARAFKPKVVYPYHYRGQNTEEFKSALAGEPIEVRLLNWYPGQPPGDKQ